MIVGVPREIKEFERRVALTPAEVQELTARGHRVLIERGAGQGCGISDDEFRAAGATSVDRETVFRDAELIVKVKEPLQDEPDLLHAGQILFTYLHLAAAPELTQRLLRSRVAAIGYETVTEPDGSLPLLIPMSMISGRLAPQVGAWCLETAQGGRGVLLGGALGVPPAEVTILGGGTVATNAARVAEGMGARVTMIERSPQRMRQLDELFQGRVAILASTADTIALSVERSDLVIGAVLQPGARAPVLVTEELVRRMKPGAAIVDVAIDQGGCVATSRPTTIGQPIFTVDGVIHYCVTNMPSLVARTATYALANAVLPYLLTLADQGIEGAIRTNPALAKGLNLYHGRLTCKAVADSLSLAYTPVEQVLG